MGRTGRPSASRANLLALQRAAGNGAVTQLLGTRTVQRKPGDKDAVSLGIAVLKAIMNPEKPVRDGEAIVFRGYRFTSDQAQVKDELLKVFAKSMPVAQSRSDMVDTFVRVFGERAVPAQIADPRPKDQQSSGTPTEKLVTDVKAAMEAGRGAVRSWRNAFAGEFVIDAVKAADDVLDKSKEQVEKERDRYGIKVEKKKIAFITYSEKRTMAEGGDASAILMAVRDLHSKFAIYAAFAGLRQGGLSRPDMSDENVRTTAGSYNAARGVAERRFPIIAAFELDLTKGPELEAKFKNIENEPAQVLGEQVEQKLDNISKSRQALWEEGSRIWLLPSLVTMTRSRKQITDGSHQAAAVDEQVTTATVHKQNVDFIKGALAIGVGLLASPLGPAASAAAGAITGALVAIDSAQEAMIQDAMNGTSFQKAQAISQQAPDWFWVAADLVLSALDLAAAAKEFVAFVKLRKEVTLARGGAGAARDENAFNKARSSLAERGNKYGHQLGDRMAEDAVKHVPTPEELARAALEQKAAVDIKGQLAELRGGKLARPQAVAALDQAVEFLPPQTVLQESGGWKQLVAGVGEDASGLQRLDAYRSNLSREAEEALNSAKNVTGGDSARQTLETTLASKSGLAADHITDILGLEIQALGQLLDKDDSGLVVMGSGVFDDLSRVTAEDAGEPSPQVQPVQRELTAAEKALQGYTGSTFEMIGSGALEVGTFASFGVPRMDIVVPGQHNLSGWGVDRIGIAVDGPRIRVYQIEFKYVSSNSSHIPELGLTSHGTQTGLGWTQDAGKALLNNNNPVAAKARGELEAALRRAGLKPDAAMMERVLLKRLPKAQVIVVTPFYAPLHVLQAQIRGLIRQGRSMILVPAAPHFGPRGGRIRL